MRKVPLDAHRRAVLRRRVRQHRPGPLEARPTYSNTISGNGFASAPASTEARFAAIAA